MTLRFLPKVAFVSILFCLGNGFAIEIDKMSLAQLVDEAENLVEDGRISPNTRAIKKTIKRAEQIIARSQDLTKTQVTYTAHYLIWQYLDNLYITFNILDERIEMIENYAFPLVLDFEGVDSDRYSILMYNLGNIRLSQGRTEEAEKLFVKADKRSSRIEEGWNILLKNGLALAYERNEQFNDAILVRNRILNLEHAHLEANSDSDRMILELHAINLSYLGQLLEESNWPEANSAFREMLVIQARINGKRKRGKVSFQDCA